MWRFSKSKYTKVICGRRINFMSCMCKLEAIQQLMDKVTTLELNSYSAAINQSPGKYSERDGPM